MKDLTIALENRHGGSGRNGRRSRSSRGERGATISPQPS